MGQPPKKDSYKVIAVGVIHVTDDLLATVGLSCDDEKGPELQALLESLSTASFKAK